MSPRLSIRRRRLNDGGFEAGDLLSIEDEAVI
jgi:hypothetical protein